MKRLSLVIGALILLGVAGFFSLTSATLWRWIHPSRDVASAAPPDLANGKTLFIAGDCAICHASPGQKDATRLGGGGALTTAFGTFYMPNISPDVADGIGAWTTAEFVTAMREGVSPHGINDYPAFPYTSYQRMTANDLRDLLGYVQTLPQVAGKAREHDLHFPFTMRRGVGVWRLAFLDGKPLATDAARPDDWRRGQYLVEGPAHCAECHSPRNFMGAIASGKRFAGGLDPAGKVYTPNITDDETGIGYWSANEIASYLKDGISPINIAAGGDMAEIIADTSRLSDADRHAIGVYVKSIAGVHSLAPGMPEPNHTTAIRMLAPQNAADAHSKLAALTAQSGDQIDKATTLYVVTTKDLFLQSPGAESKATAEGKLLASTKLTLVGRQGGWLQVRVDGWQQDGADQALYALQGQRIVEAVLTPAAAAKVVRTKRVHDDATGLDWRQASVTVWVDDKGMNTDLAALWTYGGDLFSATCAACHSLPESTAYLSNQWIGTLGAMKRYASLDDGQYRLLLAYLQNHSKDVTAPAVKP
jgi:mono/diheme cytochrome c family protein